MRFYVNNVILRIDFSFILIIATALLFENENLIYVLLFSALHEIGHIILLYSMGGKADSITLAYYGIGLKHSSSLPVNREILFLFGGIAVNLAFALLGIKRSINLALFIINAMPVYPLDGGRIFRLLLCKFFDITLSDKLLTCTGAAVITAIAIFAVIRGNVSLALIAIYLIVYSINNSSQEFL